MDTIPLTPTRNYVVRETMARSQNVQRIQSSTKEEQTLTAQLNLTRLSVCGKDESNMCHCNV